MMMKSLMALVIASPFGVEPPVFEEPAPKEPPGEPFLDPHPDPEPEPEPEPGEDVGQEPPAVAPAITHLERAQASQGEGDLETAEAEASSAIASDPRMGPAYLLRAQIRADMAAAIAEDLSAPSQRRRASLLRSAADDIDAYVEVAGLPADAEAFFTTRRDALRRDADALDPRDAPAGPERPSTSEPLKPPPIHRLPAEPLREPLVDELRPTRWSQTAVILGSAAAAIAAGTGAASLRVEQRCGTLCSASFMRRGGLLGPSIGLAALGAAAVPFGAAAWIRATDAPGRRRWRTAGIVMVAASGVAIVAASITGGLAQRSWGNDVPSSDGDLMTTQRLANATVSLLAPAPTLLSTGLVALILTRRGAGRGRAPLGAWASLARRR